METLEKAAALKTVQILPPDEARKIAAGEVIDRPAALVRELMDNAIDSGASRIEVSIEGGGAVRTEVSDDGEGMSRNDLELCWQPHATSKIRSLDDLRTAETLGFRGEALAAVAAVSRLEIVTSRDNDSLKLTVGPGELYPSRIEHTNRTGGTSVRAIGLFDAIPARKRFLKSQGSESNLCRTVFNDKALVFPGIEFRLVQDGKLKTLLRPVLSFKKRFVELYFSGEEEIFIYEIAATGNGFNAVILIGGPELYRSDRRQQFIFANGRRIQDFSLLQAVEYGVQGWFPNGTHPVGAVMLNIDPALADFNIHPAKREARFADPGSIHHAVSSALKKFFHDAIMGGRMTAGLPQRENYGSIGGTLAFEAFHTAEDAPHYTTPREVFDAEISIVQDLPAGTPQSSGQRLRYLGWAFRLFILVEKDDRIYAIDQHAAHERILYNRFIEGPVSRQELLVAIRFDTESAEDDLFLRTRQNELAKLGVVITEENGSWFIEALPSGWRLGDSETVKEILELKNAGENMTERWAMTLSCRKAVKDGSYLDPETALALAEEALKLPVRRCPHGRPVCFEITRDEMLKAVRRL